MKTKCIFKKLNFVNYDGHSISACFDIQTKKFIPASLTCDLPQTFVDSLKVTYQSRIGLTGSFKVMDNDFRWIQVGSIRDNCSAYTAMSFINKAYNYNCFVTTIPHKGLGEFGILYDNEHPLNIAVFPINSDGISDVYINNNGKWEIHPDAEKTYSKLFTYSLFDWNIHFNIAFYRGAEHFFFDKSANYFKIITIALLKNFHSDIESRTAYDDYPDILKTLKDVILYYAGVEDNKKTYADTEYHKTPKGFLDCNWMLPKEFEPFDEIDDNHIVFLNTSTQFPHTKTFVYQIAALQELYPNIPDAEYEFQYDVPIHYLNPSEYRRIKQIAPIKIKHKSKKELIRQLKQQKENQKLWDWIEHNKHLTISIQDSIDAGNCKYGTKQFIQKYNLHDSSSIDELMQHPKWNEFKSNSAFIRTLKHIMLKNK